MKNEIDYENKNGLLYPLLTLPQTEEQPLGKYGKMYLDYIKKHRRGTYTTLLTEGRLAAYLADFDRETREQVKVPPPSSRLLRALRRRSKRPIRSRGRS